MIDKNNPPDQDTIEGVIDLFSKENQGVHICDADRKDTYEVLRHLYLDYFEMKDLWLAKCRECDALRKAGE